MSTQSDLRSLKYFEAIREATQQEMQRDDRVFLMGLDVDDHKGIQGSTLGLVDEFGASRVFTTPLSEDAMTGVAIGAAMAGQRPIHAHIRMDFLLLCMNQLINIAAKSHYMYAGQVQVPMVIRTMIGKSWGQGGQHSQGLHSMFMHVPGIKIVAPSNAYDVKGCMIAAIRDNNPVVVMEHRLLYGTSSYVPEEPYEIEFGKARVARSGGDVTIVGISSMQLEALRAAEILQEKDISAEIIDPISLSPLDSETIIKSVRKTKRLVVVDSGWLTCGASAEIITKVTEALSNEMTFSVKRIGFAEATCPTTPSLEDVFYPNSGTIAQVAYKMLHPNKEWCLDPSVVELAHEKEFKGPF
ncbi:alpha-ketoacid dehydrogenase subunit beta [Curvivirga sp.]|uniref:alpha-ketoacid dehydrogenase subunit beta n=1 Tax=Curvivirga sp. TaxID=2856848 RepID=UPI003B5BDED1